MLTVDQVLDILDADPHAANSPLVDLARRERRHPDRSTHAHLEFLDGMQNRRVTTTLTVPVHPATNLAARTPRPRGPLSDDERAFLDRLPANPAAVAWRDARRLAVLHSAREEGQLVGASADRVRDAWAPVDRHHAELASAADLRLAEEPDITLWPSSTIQALADAFAAEHPDLDEATALDCARDCLTTYRIGRDRRRTQDIADARAHLADLTSRA